MFSSASLPAYLFSSFFFFNDTATTEIYTLSLHDALPISVSSTARGSSSRGRTISVFRSPSKRHSASGRATRFSRSEEHTSELQSRLHLVCRLLLEKKKKLKRHDSSDFVLISFYISIDQQP